MSEDKVTVLPEGVDAEAFQNQAWKEQPEERDYSKDQQSSTQSDEGDNSKG